MRRLSSVIFCVLLICLLTACESENYEKEKTDRENNKAFALVANDIPSGKYVR